MTQTKKQLQEQEKEEAKQTLRKMFLPQLKKGIKPTVHTILKHVSSSGMMRHIDVVYITPKGEPIKLNWYIEKVGLYRRAKDYNAKNADSLRVSGCGMDMGFSVVYNLARSLFQDAKEIASFKVVGRNGDKYETTDGGYLLNQRWL